MAEYVDVPLFPSEEPEFSTVLAFERIGYLETLLCDLAQRSPEAASSATRYVRQYQDVLPEWSRERFRKALNLEL